MLTLKHASYHYRKGADAIHDISCEIGTGFHLLIGENGAGKTTLLHLMGGLRYPTHGTCDIDGTPLRLRRPSELCRVQYFCNSFSFPGTTVAEMAEIHAPQFPGFDHDMLMHNLSRFSIKPDDKFRHMSLGTSVKARLAYMLALRCDVLLLDEPTTGLDISSRQILNRMLVECVSADQSVVISTHSAADFEALYDSIMVLKNGHLILDSEIADMSERIAFTSSPKPPANALFSELHMGMHRCIIPNPGGKIESQPDITLLYNALHSINPQPVLDLLNTRCS